MIKLQNNTNKNIQTNGVPNRYGSPLLYHSKTYSLFFVPVASGFRISFYIFL